MTLRIPCDDVTKRQKSIDSRGKVNLNLSTIENKLTIMVAAVMKRDRFILAASATIDPLLLSINLDIAQKKLPVCESKTFPQKSNFIYQKRRRHYFFLRLY